MQSDSTTITCSKIVSLTPHILLIHKGFIYMYIYIYIYMQSIYLSIYLPIYVYMLFFVNVGFSGLKPQTHFSSECTFH